MGEAISQFHVAASRRQRLRSSLLFNEMVSDKWRLLRRKVQGRSSQRHAGTGAL
jgi:hypothetical protein